MSGSSSGGALHADIAAVAARFGHPVDGALIARLAAFVELLMRWNARINLTGARTGTELVRDHLPDSFAMSALVPPAARAIDVGSGGGLPALPFALLRPDVALTLVEPRAKRVAFLRAAVRELALSAKIVAGRIEAVHDHFDVAGSRATFPPAEWWPKGETLLAPGGRLLFFLNEAAEAPFPGSAPHQEVRYQAGDKGRVVMAWVKPGSR